ncbi:MAG TPA: agmatine deiminase [Candidatus Woesebacteria bacterium]|nr:agmatine deiminase [Candidatus Woesebacteria bacterium]
MKLNSLPVEDGFSMMAESDVIGSLWLLLPTRPDNWRDNATPVQNTYVNLIETISRYVKVNVGIEHKRFMHLFNTTNKKNIKVHILNYDDAWIRDTGPIFLKDEHNHVRGVKWRFNAWGGMDEGLYANWEQDDLIGERICDIGSIDYYLNDMILEGGSVLSDEFGTLYTTESCLLNKNRNPKKNKKEIEKNLIEYLGVNRVVWIPEGLKYDETDGHVDNVCLLADKRRILLHWTNDKNDPQYEIVREAKKTIEIESKSESYNYEIIKVESPRQVPLKQYESKGISIVEGTYSRNSGDYVISSYVNAYQDRNIVVLPQFGDREKDSAALNLFRKVYPNKNIIPFPAREIIIGGGGLHCITLVQPA